MFALRRPQHLGPAPRVTQEISAGIGVCFSAYKSSNISEKRQDSTKVTIEDQ